MLQIGITIKKFKYLDVKFKEFKRSCIYFMLSSQIFCFFSDYYFVLKFQRNNQNVFLNLNPWYIYTHKNICKRGRDTATKEACGQKNLYYNKFSRVTTSSSLSCQIVYNVVVTLQNANVVCIIEKQITCVAYTLYVYWSEEGNVLSM